jgi:anaerobic glycerol-3-phosphate dehydrogenase
LVEEWVCGFEQKGGQISALRLKSGEMIAGDTFVLCSGKFIGRGLVHDPRLREAIFDLPVWIGNDGPSVRYLGRYLHRRVMGPHELFSAGLRVDQRLRPLTQTKRPAWSNLFGAGSVLGGYDYILGRTGLGTALVTGFLAGTYAAGGDRPWDDSSRS